MSDDLDKGTQHMIQLWELSEDVERILSLSEQAVAGFYERPDSRRTGWKQTDLLIAAMNFRKNRIHTDNFPSGVPESAKMELGGIMEELQDGVMARGSTASHSNWTQDNADRVQAAAVRLSHVADVISSAVDSPSSATTETA